MKKYEGFVTPIVPILIVAAILAIIFIPKINHLSTSLSPSLVSSPLPAPTNSPTPTIVPTSTSTSTPMPTPTVKPATPKPTVQPVSGPPGAGYSSITVATQKGNFGARVISIDLNSARMITDSANDNDCGNGCLTIPLADYVNRNGGFAGVNGTYFCPGEPAYTECSSKTNSFDFPIWNTRLGHWINGGNLFWNSRAIFYVDGSGAHYLQNANSFSGSLNAGVVNFPGLLENGNVQIDDNQSGLSDKQKARGTKVGIGLRDSKNVMIVIASAVNMQVFAYVFKALGATGALNLDTGGSTALYYNGKYLAGPGRSIPNAIIFAR